MTDLATPTADPAAPAELRFMAGARERDSGVFYNKTQALGASSVQLDEAQVPAGDWLRDIVIMVDGVTAGNSADVAFGADAPFNAINVVRFLDANGTVLHQLTGYQLYLVNLLGAIGVYQTDAQVAPGYSAVTGTGATGGSFSYVLVLPVQIIPRDAIGALPNGASNSVTRVQVELAPSATVYAGGTAPTNPPTVQVRMIERGYVQPARLSPGGRTYADMPPGGNRTFRQLGAIPYDIPAVGSATVPLIRKGNVYRMLTFVARTAAGARSDSVISNLKFRLDRVENFHGPWSYLKWLTWSRQAITAAQLPAGVVQASFCHEWDGLVGGEVRDMYVPTLPGSLVELEYDAAAVGTLEVITDEIVTPIDAGVLNA